MTNNDAWATINEWASKGKHIVFIPDDHRTRVQTLDEEDAGLVHFLLARISEEESAAHYALSRDDGGALEYGGQWYGAVEHARKWEPARVLRECSAKRAVIKECVEGLRCVDDGAVVANNVLVALAASYSDHPRYEDARYDVR